MKIKEGIFISKGVSLYLLFFCSPKSMPRVTYFSLFPILLSSDFITKGKDPELTSSCSAATVLLGHPGQPGELAPGGTPAPWREGRASTMILATVLLKAPFSRSLRLHLPQTGQLQRRLSSQRAGCSAFHTNREHIPGCSLHEPQKQRVSSFDSFTSCTKMMTATSHIPTENLGDTSENEGA